MMDNLKGGYFSRQIAHKVASVSHMTIAKRRKKAAVNVSLPDPERPSVLTNTDKRIVRDITTGKDDTVVVVAKQLTETSQKTIHPKASSRVLQKNGLKFLRKQKKPSLLGTL